MNQTHTSLDLYTAFKANQRLTPTKSLPQCLKKTPSVSGTAISVFLRLRLPPSQGHPSQGHPSRLHPSQGHPSRLHQSQGIRLSSIRLRGHPSQGASVSVPSVSGASLSRASVSGASVSGTSVSETVTAPTNDTNGYPSVRKTLRRRAHPS